jgi:5'-deoxynucleotidase YfbR-like HD superfamily hydrolase
MSRLLGLFSITQRLENLTRFSMERTSKPESVLEHVGMVALFSMAMAYETGADLETVFCRAVVHDLEEVVTGDIARPTKHNSDETRQIFEDLSARAMDRISTDLSPLFPHFASDLEDHHRTAKDNTLEGIVISAADVLAVVFRVWDEVVVRGNRSMMRQAYTCSRQVASLKGRACLYKSSEFIYGLLEEAELLLQEAIKHDDKMTAKFVERETA